MIENWLTKSPVKVCQRRDRPISDTVLASGEPLRGALIGGKRRSLLVVVWSLLIKNHSIVLVCGDCSVAGTYYVGFYATGTALTGTSQAN